MVDSNQHFRVLFIYPNIQMRTIAPPSVAILSALLKDHGFVCEVFDCTRYENVYVNPERDYDTSHEKFLRMNIHNDRVKNSNVPDFDWGERNIELKSTDMGADLRAKIETFDPRLICMSLVENTYQLAMDLLSVIPGEVPVICGGVFCTYAPEIVIKNPKVDYVCRGEGEYPLLDLCQALSAGKSTRNIPNLWLKDGDSIIQNGMRPAIDINELPVPDYSVFEKELLYTPMQGRVWRAVGFETQRGCPFTCTYCNSPSNNILYAGESAGRFYRKKSVKKMKEELEFLMRAHRPELVYFVADTFLAMSKMELDEFSEFYQSYKIPFWMNTRAETITEHSAEHLAKMNCLRFNIGIEHGNEEFRTRVLSRKVSNDGMVGAFQIAAQYASEYTCVANSIIGLPTETSTLAFDTIELNRRLPDEIFAAGAFIFAPFYGTPLRELAIEKGYISSDLICTEGSNTTPHSLLNMPNFTPEEIVSLMKTFSFYVKFPRSRWPEIDRARQNTPEGIREFEALREEYSSTHLAPQPEKSHEKGRVAHDLRVDAPSESDQSPSPLNFGSKPYAPLSIIQSKPAGGPK